MVLAIAIVWVSEAFNTAIEAICNLISPEVNSLVKVAKDVGAGAVLLCASAAAIIGVLTLWPYVLR